MIIIYIYIPPSSEVCKISDPDEKNALAPWGAQKNDQGLKSILDQNSMPFIVEVSLSRGNYGPGCQTTEVNHFISYEFLYLGHPTSEQIHMNFSTSDTPKVSHEFLLYLGHLTSQQIHMNFLTWDTPKVNHFNVSLITCLLGNLKYKGRKYPSEGQNCPGTV